MHIVFEAIGTKWDIEAVCPDKEIEDTCIALIHSRIESFDKIYSRFRNDSHICKLSVDGGSVEFPDDFFELITFYKQLYDLTNGLFTPLIGNTLSDAGYDKSYSLKEKKLHSPPRWEDIITYDRHTLSVTKPVLLDFGAAGKGYLVDILSEIFFHYGVSEFCIDGGGDIKHSGNKPIRIGLEHPTNTSQVIGTVDIQNRSICGSSGNRRKWGNFHHILNPFTLNSPTTILSVWVIAEKAITADGISTALFFEKPEIVKTHFQFEYFILYSDYRFKKSDGFDAVLFTS